MVSLRRRAVAAPSTPRVQAVDAMAHQLSPVLHSDAYPALELPATALETAVLFTQRFNMGEALPTAPKAQAAWRQALHDAYERWPLVAAVVAAVADAALSLGDTPLALKAYQRWQRLCPAQSRAAFGVALAYEQQGHLPQAQAAYELALALDASYLAVYHNLGTLYLHTGQAGKALALFRELKQRYPRYAPAVLGLAMAYDTLGDVRRACRRYRLRCAVQRRTINE
jgi:tetratricopeptide (TPR) repeat protein